MSHGTKEISKSVFTSWLAQGVLIISGFIIPRFINDGLGKEALGVWDFAWSLITHFALIQAGVTGSVNRYVAKLRSEDAHAELNRVVSSVAGVLRFMGGAVLLITGLSVLAMDLILREPLAGYIVEARWIVGLLGVSLAVQIMASVYGGVLTGCHRWDWHNAVHVATYGAILLGMLLVLKWEYGLVGLAAVSLVGETVGRLARMNLAQRALPGLEIRWRHMRKKTALEMIRFGGKTFLYNVSHLILHQTINVLILSYLGPAALAVFARPVALIRTVNSFALKYANVFVPTMSSLQAAGDFEEVKKLTVTAARYGVFFCLPPLLMLGLMGEHVLELWMGPEYGTANVIALLVGAKLFSIAHAPLFYCLVGLDRHGRAVSCIFGSAIVGALATYVWLAHMDGSLAGIPLAFGLPWAVVNGIYLPIHCFRQLGIGVGQALVSAWLRPLLYCAPFAIALLILRYSEFETPLLAVLATAAAGVVLVGVPYWFGVVPDQWKEKILLKLRLVKASSTPVTRPE